MWKSKVEKEQIELQNLVAADARHFLFVENWRQFDGAMKLLTKLKS